MKIAIGLTIFLSLPLLGGDVFDAGTRAYREGRFKEALEAFIQAERSASGDASAELLYNQSLAALQAGELGAAEVAAKKAAAAGGRGFEALRDFLLGNIAFARCEQAEMQSKGPEAEPFAFDAALVRADTARTLWQRAASSRPDWPEARRNVERALLKIMDLKKKKKEAAEARNRKKKEKDLEVRPQPRPKPLEPEARDTEAEIEPQLKELSPEDVARIFDRLNDKEREKLALRRALRQSKGAEVERDW